MSDTSLKGWDDVSRSSGTSIRIPWSILQSASFFLLAAATLLNMADFVGGKVENKLDLQVMVKLAICSSLGLLGIYGAFNWSKVSRVLLAPPVLILFLIGIMFLFSIPFSSDRSSSFVSTGLYWTILLSVIAGMHCMGRERALDALITGLIAFVVASWIAFLFVPSLGIFHEPIPDGQFQARMNGISHPNTLGIFSGILSALLIAQGRLGRIKWRWLLIPLVLAIGAMVLSLSRTSMAALFISAIIVNRDVFRRKSVFLASLIAIAIFVLVLFATSIKTDLTLYTQDILEKFSKSGDVEELTSGTGRSEIWAFAIEKIIESPIVGNGLATSKSVMIDHSGYTHNLWLNLFFSAGVPCGLLGIALALYLLGRVFVRPHPIIDGAVVFLMINGLTENVVFNAIPSGPTILLIIATAWPMFAAKQKSRFELEDELLAQEQSKRGEDSTGGRQP